MGGRLSRGGDRKDLELIDRSDRTVLCTKR